MSEIEANIQAELQAKLNSGASKADLLAQADSMDLTMAPAATDAQSVIASVLAKHNIAAPVASPAMSVAQTQPKPAAPATPTAEDTKASQEKVKEMAQKLGIPFTQDLMDLGSNSAISDALIEKAVAAGKTEQQINDAMAQL